MRMVSALEASSDSDGAGGISSAIEGESVLVVYLTQPFASQLPYHSPGRILFIPCLDVIFLSLKYRLYARGNFRLLANFSSE